MDHADERIRLGISACLLGEKVRFDGGHKRDAWIVDTLGQFVDFVPVCPEVGMGLPVPREALRLVGNPDSPRLVFVRSGEDMTGRMQAWAAQRLDELEREHLCGFIFKRASPSSGMERVKVYRDVPPEKAATAGPPSMTGVGVFAAAFMERFPLVPVEEEGRLHDPALRENFIVRLFAMQRWRRLLAAGVNARSLVPFHTRHKLLIMSHSVELYRESGRLVAGCAGMNPDELADAYQSLLMTALSRRATVKKHTNVLQHIMGYFKRVLSADEKQELGDLIAAYHAGLVPLIVPVTLCNHYVRKYDERYLAGQWYLAPHPLELKLRNHA